MFKTAHIIRDLQVTSKEVKLSCSSAHYQQITWETVSCQARALFSVPLDTALY